MSTQHSVSVAVTEQHERDNELRLRITRALGRMPYLPMTHTYYSTSADLESLASTLENFADTLTEIGERNSAESEELFRLKQDLTTLRRLLGTES